MKTYQDVSAFLTVANRWLQKHPEDRKFRYALNKVVKTATKLMQDYNDQFEAINIDNCAVDDKSVILRDEKGDYRFTKEGLKTRNEAANKLFRSEVAFEPYYATEIPDDKALTVDEREYLYGFVLREEVEATEKAEGASV